MFHPMCNISFFLFFSAPGIYNCCSTQCRLIWIIRQRRNSQLGIDSSFTARNTIIIPVKSVVCVYSLYYESHRLSKSYCFTNGYLRRKYPSLYYMTYITDAFEGGTCPCESNRKINFASWEFSETFEGVT